MSEVKGQAEHALSCLARRAFRADDKAYCTCSVSSHGAAGIGTGAENTAGVESARCPQNSSAPAEAGGRGEPTFEETIRAELKLLLLPLRNACDREWKNETAEQTIAIAANAIYWRDREIARLREAAHDTRSQCADTNPDRDCPCGGRKGQPDCMFPEPRREEGGK